MSLGVRLHGGGIFCACMRRSKDTSVKSNWRIFGMAIGLLALIVVSGAVGFIYGAIASNTKGGPFYRARVGERIDDAEYFQAFHRHLPSPKEASEIEYRRFHGGKIP